MSISVFYEATPNPQSMKFIATITIASETFEASDVRFTERSPLAKKIMGFPWADRVFIGSNFVTITKQEWVGWDVLADPLSDLIKEHLERNEPVLFEASEFASADDNHNNSSTDSDVVKRIKHVLNSDIRPAVAMDGGDIAFDRFENGKVYLEMRGACSGCPSSAYTLKEGIEVRLKELIPEVEEVVQA